MERDWKHISSPDFRCPRTRDETWPADLDHGPHVQHRPPLVGGLDPGHPPGPWNPGDDLPAGPEVFLQSRIRHDC